MILHLLCSLLSSFPVASGPAAPVVPGHAAVAGDELPKGPPWFQTYRSARRDGLRHGRPVFVYFTKTV